MGGLLLIYIHEILNFNHYLALGDRSGFKQAGKDGKFCTEPAYQITGTLTHQARRNAAKVSAPNAPHTAGLLQANEVPSKRGWAAEQFIAKLPV